MPAIFRPLVSFFQENYIKVLVVLGMLFVFYSIFNLTVSSLKKLRKETSPYYPFDPFIPASGNWSVGYFLVVILLLGLLIFFLSKGKFYHLGPA
jgi:hypothetical protein